MPEHAKFSIKEFYQKHPIICNILLIILTGFILLWGALLFLDSWTLHGDTAVVPDIKHKSYADAKAALEANKLTIEISDSIYDPAFGPGTVIESWPKPGAVVKDGRQVFVTVTAFSPKQVTISMPMTGNVSSRQAISYLRGIGISDIRLEHVPSEFVDLVVAARYGNTPLNVGTVLPVTSTVTLTVGSGYSEENDSIPFENPSLELEPEEE
ncbi:MAG: PASTA domain-containing protein [Muribaculaceae bacterium]|nr:PASTA domain-containing protein [Muribaculaceae bacterium]